MSQFSQDAQAEASTDANANVLMDVIGKLVEEMRPHAAAQSLTLDSAFERDLGIDSLGRVELLERIEQTFGYRLPEHVIISAETPRDLLRMLQHTDLAAAPQLANNPQGAAPVLQTSNGEVAIPLHAQTLVEVLEWHAQHHPQRQHITLYGDDETLEYITYGDLYSGAMAIAAALRQRDLMPRQTVALMLPTSRAFFESFLGILLAGAIPVPLYPPVRPSQIEDHMRRQIGILDNAQATMMITIPEVQTLARLLQPKVPTLRHVVTKRDLEGATSDGTRPTVEVDDIAFLQYTSGSTGNPKGVVLTHANLLANIRAMMMASEATPQDVFVSWLPLYHDMGLIGAWLGSLYQAYHLVIMSPLTFLTRPQRWLEAIHVHRGTLSGGPNFAYELCVRRVRDEDIAGYDLSSWRIAFSGAEPVSPATMQRFTDRFTAYGFQSRSMSPVYGLAEGTLGLAFPAFGNGPRLDPVQREVFTRTGQAAPADPDDPDPLTFVSCGYPLPGHQIRIVDSAGYEVPERREGHLEFSGPSATSGYFRNPEASRELERDGWIDSGDLAYVAEGEVFITGRAKDMIIRAGRNLHPYELEEAVGNLPGVRKGCVAAFGSRDSATGTERLVVLAETRETGTEEQTKLRSQIDALVVDMLGAPADDVVLAPPQTVLKTSSGKIRRAASRERYEQGDIGKRPSAIWWQILRLGVASLWPRIRRTSRSLLELAYGLAAWAVLGITVVMVLITIAIVPTQQRRQALAQRLARLALRILGIRLTVHGLDHIPETHPYVVVVNHSSYVDAVALMATLPPGLSYVGKRELGKVSIARFVFERLGVEFVERLDTQKSIEDSDRLLQLVQGGQSIVFFPEGTFGREPGLRPFRMGAFTIAAQVGAPVVPVALRGTRSVLRGEQWLPHPRPIRVTILPALYPKGTEWLDRLSLREATRQAILQHCGEPALENPAEPTVFEQQTQE
ncbi:MAG: AMP-dependent synthetase and ligase [Candidatus Entotheonella factor]|uniref:AMP-dependent synthetase and ligase n=2 Tax=Candidatus Entotheonella TaxID=93171 RepID=W4LY37_ENTF1|nr:MAG: AMP-dependent synthetase and ligase [Candidatus Entotheonella factor]